MGITLGQKYRLHATTEKSNFVAHQIVVYSWTDFFMFPVYAIICYFGWRLSHSNSVIHSSIATETSWPFK